MVQNIASWNFLCQTALNAKKLWIKVFSHTYYGYFQILFFNILSLTPINYLFLDSSPKSHDAQVCRLCGVDSISVEILSKKDVAAQNINYILPINVS